MDGFGEDGGGGGILWGGAVSRPTLCICFADPVMGGGRLRISKYILLKSSADPWSV